MAALGGFGLSLAAAGLAGASGLSLATGAAGLSLMDAAAHGPVSQAAINLAHDMSLGLGIAITSNPTISMYAADSNPVGTPGIDVCCRRARRHADVA